MTIKTVWAFSLLFGLAACTEESRQNMGEDTSRAGEGIEREVESSETLDQELQEEPGSGLRSDEDLGSER